MIDLDQLDAQLERALTDDVRALRSSPPRPRFDHSPTTVATASGAPRTLAEKLASITDDLDAPAPAPAPARGYVDVADYVDVSEPEPQLPLAGPHPGPAPEPVPRLDLDDLVDFAEPAPPPAARTARPAPPRPTAPQPRQAPVMTDPPPARPPVARLTGVPYFEKRPSELAPASAPPTAPAPNLVSARERLRQAAVRQAHGLTDDGAPGSSALAARIPALLAQGLIDDLDRDLEAHAAMASAVGSSDDRLAAATWKVMRCALDGRRDEAQSALRVVNALGHGDERYWAQRFWLALEWGGEDERFAVLEHCWERAYRYDDLTWRGALCLLLARMGRTEEAAREVDAVLAALQGTTPEGFADIVTNLAEAVFVLGDRTRAAALQRPLTKVRDHLVVTGPALTCKGASARFQAHVAWATGNAAAADRHFAAAAESHRAMGARPLLARTLQEWGATLAGRDDVRAQRCLGESAAIADELGLAQPRPALAG
ncbi:MAG: hypothetical protein ACLGI2_13245 [Acidimicrobiia bacterium]